MMKIIGCYTEPEAREIISKYTSQQLQPLPDDKVVAPNTVFSASISNEDGIEKSVLLMLPSSKVVEHGHPGRVKETYSGFSLKSHISKTRVAIREDCKAGQTHSLENTSTDKYAVVFSTKKR